MKQFEDDMRKLWKDKEEAAEKSYDIIKELENRGIELQIEKIFGEFSIFVKIDGINVGYIQEDWSEF